MTKTTIAARAICTIKVNVVSSTPGVYTNTIPANAIQAQQGVTNTGAASAPLYVQAIGITKAFSPTNFQNGGISTLKITLKNPSSSPYTGVAFTDNLPAGLTVASVPNSPQCSGAVSSTSDSITLTGGKIPVNSTCTVTISVTAANGGSYDNPSETVTSTNGGIGNTASATLTVVSPPAISKAFFPDSIGAGETSSLTFTITNPIANTVPLTGVAFTDAFPAGMQVAKSSVAAQIAFRAPCLMMRTATALSMSVNRSFLA